MLSNGCISTVGQRAAAPVAEACNVVLIAAEVLDLGLRLEAAVMVIYDLQPQHVCKCVYPCVLRQLPQSTYTRHSRHTGKDQPRCTQGGPASSEPPPKYHVLTCQMISSFCMMP